MSLFDALRQWTRAGLLRAGAAALLVAVAPTAAAAADFRGFASAGPFGVLLFQECRGKQVSPSLLKIEDETPDAALSAGVAEVRAIMMDPARPLYVEFRGQMAGRDLKALQFHRAIGTVESCVDAPADIRGAPRLWAGGQEPTWQLVVSGREARLERPGEKPVRFPVAPFVAPAKSATIRTIDAWSALDGGTVHVEITEQMCTDGRSETAYGTTVMLRYGSRTYEGCAARF
jgi:uncharacterized membrane protein